VCYFRTFIRDYKITENRIEKFVFHPDCHTERFAISSSVSWPSILPFNFDFVRDARLEALLVRSGSPEEMKEKVALTESPLSDPAPSINNSTKDDTKRPSAGGREKNEYQTAP
jgi:hypothetical protein